VVPPSYVYAQPLWLFGISPQPVYGKEQFVCHIADAFDFSALLLNYKQIHGNLDGGATLQYLEKVSHMDNLSQGRMRGFGFGWARKRGSGIDTLFR